MRAARREAKARARLEPLRCDTADACFVHLANLRPEDDPCEVQAAVRAVAPQGLLRVEAPATGEGAAQYEDAECARVGTARLDGAELLGRPCYAVQGGRPRAWDDDAVPIDGLEVVRDAITEEEEAELLRWLQPPDERGGGGHPGWLVLSRRLVRHFGFHFDYSLSRATDAVAPLPPFCHWLLPRLVSPRGSIRTTPNQLTVNLYRPGDGIPPHIDTHSAFEESIASLSLCSTVAMQFGRSIGGRLVQRSVVLPRRSLLVLNGAARYAWTHGIATRKTDVLSGRVVPRGRRISLTFRTTRHLPCACAFAADCDRGGGP